MPTPLVTILVPTYRRPGPLSDCLQSIELAGLAADDVEILVCDNASPDGTPQVVAGHQTRHQLRYVRRAENLGARRNIRLGAGEAWGEWVLFLTDDDRLDSQGARALLPILRFRRDLGYVVSSFRSVDPEGRVLRGWSPARVDQELPPGPRTSARWAASGWVFSRLAFRRDVLDFIFWDRHLANAYPSVLLAARSLLHAPGLYLARSLVDHAVGNLVHWEEFGEGQYAIWRKTHLDYAEVLEVAYADAGIDSPSALRAASRWRRQALGQFIAAAIGLSDGPTRLRADREALASAFRVPVPYVNGQVILAQTLRPARRVQAALARCWAEAGPRSPRPSR